MKALIEQLPFPWSRPEAQELHRRLCVAYPTPITARAIVTYVAGLDAAQIDWSGPTAQVWTSILNTSAIAAKTRALLDRVLADASVAAIHDDVRRIMDVPGELAAVPPVPAEMSQGEALAGLEAFLLEAFSMDELRRLIRWELPELDKAMFWSAAPGTVAQEFVATALRQTAFGKLFPLIDAARPRRVGELTRIRQALLKP